jgi:hypothetical protein
MVAGPQPKRVVMAAAAAMVPPGRAIRIHEERANKGIRARMPTEHALAVGARWVVAKNLTAMIRKGSIIETTDEDGETYLSLSERARKYLTK